MNKSKKFLKKGLAAVLSVLMVSTSLAVPMVASAADSTNTEIVALRESIDSTISSFPYSANAQGKWYKSDNSQVTMPDGSYSSVLFAGDNSSSNNCETSSTTEKTKAYLRLQPIAFLYDGVTETKAPIMVVYGTSSKADRHINSIRLTDDSNNSLQMLSKWKFSRDNSYGNNWDFPNAWERNGGTDLEASYEDDDNYPQIGKSGAFSGWTTTPGMASYFKFGGSFSSGSYYMNISPTVTAYQGGDSPYNNVVDTMEATRNVQVVNYKPIRDKADDIKSKYNDVKANESAYCESSLLSYYNAVANAIKDPNTYFSSASSDNYITCAENCGNWVKDVMDNSMNVATTGPQKHTVVTDVAVAPTCTATGLTEGSHCSVCNAVIVAQTEVSAKGHTAVTDAAVAPTCTATGLTEGSHCSVCNAVLVAQTEVSANGHTAVTDAAVAPTCTETGLTEGSHCSVCNAIITEQQVVPANGHTWDEGVYTNPTYTADGYTTYTCTVCNETKVVTDTGSMLKADYTAYDNALAEYNNKIAATDYATTYTAPSRTAYENAVAAAMLDKANANTQDEVNAAITAILSAQDLLVVDIINVTFEYQIDNNSAVKVIDDKQYHYGDAVEMVVPNTALAGSSLYKWVVSYDNGDTWNDYTTNNSAVTYVVTKGAVFKAILTSNAVTEVDNQYKVTVVDMSDKTTSVTYLSSEVTLNYTNTTVTIGDVEMNVKTYPFYKITGYTVNGEVVNSGDTIAIDGATVIKPVYEAKENFEITAASGKVMTFNDVSSENGAYYAAFDEKVTVTAENATVWYSNGILVGYGKTYTFRASSSAEISYNTTADEKVAHSYVNTTTCYFDGTNKKMKVVAGFITPDGFKYNAAGIVISRVPFDQDNKGTAVPTKSYTNENQYMFTVNAKGDDFTIYVKAYYTYTDTQGETHTVYSDVKTVNSTEWNNL